MTRKGPRKLLAAIRLAASTWPESDVYSASEIAASPRHQPDLRVAVFVDGES